MNTLNVKIVSHDETVKEFSEAVNCDSFTEYLHVLQTIQKDVNSALTEIVEREQLNQDITEDNLEDDDDDDEEESDDNSSIPVKRKTGIHKETKKIKT